MKLETVDEVVVVKPKNYVLTLTEEEFECLAAICGNVAAIEPGTVIRKLIFAIYDSPEATTLRNYGNRKHIYLKHEFTGTIRVTGK